jgi:tetratricopeptide (TPR) repeat protein
MAVRRFNWKLLFVILIGAAVLTVTAFGLRTWQKNRMAAGRLTSGNKAYADGQWAQAASDFGKYIAVAGGTDVPILLKYADAQLNIRPLKRDNVQQAVSTYRSVLRLQPDNYEASTQLIELYLEMDMHGESELIARRQLERISDPNIQRMLVVALVGQRKFKEAAAELDSLIKAHPDDILAYEAMSRLCEQRPTEYDKQAQYWLDEAVRRNPMSAMAYIVRGAFEFRIKMSSRAATDFEYAQKLDLSNTDVRLRLARELISAGQLSAAKEHLTVLQSAQPKDAALWQTWAMLASKSGSKSEMLKVAKTALGELDSPSNLDFMPIAAELFIDGGDYEAAAECVETLSQQDIMPGSVAFFRGILAENQGRQYQAVKYYRQALEAGNKNPRVRFKLAELLAALGDEQSAIQQMRLLVSEHPELKDARVYFARLLLRSGMIDEAVREAQSLLRDSPNDIEVKIIYVQTQIKLLATNLSDKSKISQIAKKINELETSSADKTRTNLLRFQLAMQCSDFDNAALSLAQLQEIAPNDLETAVAEVDFLMVQNKVNEAKDRLTEMVKKFPDSVAAARYSAMVLDNAGLQEECRSVLTEAVDRIKNVTAQRQLELLLAQQLRRTGKLNEASQLLNSLDKKFENDIAVKRELLKFQTIIDDSVRAQPLIDEIKDFEGQDGATWRYEQAKVWFKGSDFKKNVSEIVSLLNANLYANPGDNDSRLLLAMTYDKAGQSRQAIAAYRDALDRSPQDLRVIFPALAALYKSGEYDEADRIIKSAAGQNIVHPVLSGFELQSCLRQGQLQSAADILDDMRAVDPNNDALNLYYATIEMRQNHFEEAEKLLTALKTRQPDSSAVFSAMVEMKIRQNKGPEAITLCNEAIQRIKTAQTYILRGRTFDLLGQAQLAQKDFEYAADIEPNNAEAWMAKAQFYTIRGQNRQAASAWEKCWAISPDNPQILQQALTFFLGSPNRELNRRGNSILEKAIVSNPHDQRLEIWQARSLLLAKTAPAVDKAIGILTKVTAQHPTDVEGWSLLCQALLQKNESAKALDAVLRGLVFLPENQTLLLLKARAEATHMPELAIPTVKLLYEKDPNDADIAIYLAGLYTHGGNFTAAMSVLDAQLSMGDPSAQRKINIARAAVMYKSGHKTQSRELFESLVKDDPNDAVVTLAQAGLLKDEQKWDELVTCIVGFYQNHRDNTNAVVAISKGLSADPNVAAKEAAVTIMRNTLAINPNAPELIDELASQLYVSGHSSEALSLYQRLIELDPENLTAINNLAWIMCEEMGKHAQALELAQKGLRISPDYVDLVDTRGVAYFRLGKLDKAIQDFTVCAKLYPSHVPAAAASYFHLGRAFAVSAKKQEAAKYLKMALESNQKVGGLSANDVAEARNLLDGLLKG